MTFNLGIAPLKSVPKRKPNAKQRIDAAIANVTLAVLVIDDVLRVKFCRTNNH